MIITAEKINGRWVLPLPESVTLTVADGDSLQFRVEPERNGRAGASADVGRADDAEVLAAGDLGCDRYATALTNLAK